MDFRLLIDGAILFVPPVVVFAIIWWRTKAPISFSLTELLVVTLITAAVLALAAANDKSNVPTAVLVCGHAAGSIAFGRASFGPLDSFAKWTCVAAIGVGMLLGCLLVSVAIGGLSGHIFIGWR